ncbi:MAG TPA: adenylate/guanylate cyclase domain-containing protein [Methylophilaceae bacterium]|jgi:guanylate cyclase
MKPQAKLSHLLDIKHLVKPFSSFVHEMYSPSQNKLGTVILGVMVAAQTLISIFWINVFSSLGDGYAFMVLFPYAYIVVSYASLLIFYRLKRTTYFTFTQLAMLLVMPFFMQWIIGGFAASSSIAIWGILSPVGALLLLGTRQSTAWFVLFFVLTIVSWFLNSTFAHFAPAIPERIRQLSFLVNVSGAATILYLVMRYFQSQTEKAMYGLAIEQGKTDKLLLNILPKSIADRLKLSSEKIADLHESVTILFADIVGFTTLSAGMSPDDLVDILSQVFSRFDELTEKHGVEKIKTIGDAYMVVSGAPEPRANHAVAIVELALDMQKVLREISNKDGAGLMMRIGINSGPVVAGVIGSSKFSYDMWGDTVNMASRMESYGVPERIQVTQEAYELLKDKYKFEKREPLEVKGKGIVQSYLLIEDDVPVVSGNKQPSAVSA